jgi:hypothetical protein
VTATTAALVGTWQRSMLASNTAGACCTVHVCACHLNSHSAGICCACCTVHVCVLHAIQYKQYMCVHRQCACVCPHLWLGCLHLVEQLPECIQQCIVVLGPEHLGGGGGGGGGDGHDTYELVSQTYVDGRALWASVMCEH